MFVVLAYEVSRSRDEGVDGNPGPRYVAQSTSQKGREQQSKMPIGSFFRKSVIGESPGWISHRDSFRPHFAHQSGGHLYFLENGAPLAIQVIALGFRQFVVIEYGVIQELAE